MDGAGRACRARTSSLCARTVAPLLHRTDLSLRASAEGPLSPVASVRRRVFWFAGARGGLGSDLARVGAGAEYGIDDTVLNLNSIGDERCRPAYREALVAHFRPHLAEMSEESRQRIERNPLRLLDSKDPADAPYVESAPAFESFLCAPCREHFDALSVPRFGEHSVYDQSADRSRTRLLRENRLRNHVERARCAEQRLRRWALRWPGTLARRPRRARRRLCAGHGTLLHDARRPRLARAGSATRSPGHRVGSQARTVLTPIVAELRRTLEAPTFADYLERKLLAQLKIADRNRARYALILGSDELAAGEAVLRDLENRSDRRVPFDSIRVLVELLVEAGL